LRLAPCDERLGQDVDLGGIRVARDQHQFVAEEPDSAAELELTTVVAG
jgi:hypothetical protein